MTGLFLKFIFFFTYAATPKHVEHHDLVEPVPMAGVLAEEAVQEPDVTIQVDAAGKWSCEGKVVDGDALLALLKAKKGENDGLVVGLKAHEDTPFENYAALLELISDADIENLTFMAMGQ